MKNNFIRLAAANIKTKLLDIDHNKKEIIKYLDFAYKNKIDAINFPELTLTGVSSGEMLKSKEILVKAHKALLEIAEFTQDKNILIGLGLPLSAKSKTYSAHAIIYKGEVEYLQGKYKLNKDQRVYLNPFETSGASFEYIYDHAINNYSLAIDSSQKARIAFISEDDLMDASALYGQMVEDGANILFVAGSRPEDATSYETTKNLLCSLSKKDNLAIVYSGASSNESSTNGVYSARKYIIEDGIILEEGSAFSDDLIYSEINLDQIKGKEGNFSNNPNEYFIEFDEKDYQLRRKIDAWPMIPQGQAFAMKAVNILNIQAQALIRRLKQINDHKLFLGLSGGLDSTHALIVACYAFEKEAWDKKDIYAVIMPGLGTSERTKGNAHKLAEAYGVTMMEISINDSVLQHFKDLDHDPNNHSIVYENAQARERTQVLMDLTNKHGGIVLGTGNMSEIALGFSTYNGDHMSMYSINSGLTKTLLRKVVEFVRDQTSDQAINETLSDILDTPISPELLPTVDGQIAQKTEDHVGPYELHDFFLYHTIRNKSAYIDVLLMAENAFEGKYTRDELIKWYKVFLRRFSIQQFKRSCMPDGPAIEDFSLSPRNGFIMASDVEIFNLEEI